MWVTGQLVNTPRSKVMTGTFWQACSIAGVRAAVVLGETIRMSQRCPDNIELMSEICLSSLLSASATMNCAMSCLWRSTSACIVVHSTTRQGLPTPALEKQIRYGPGFLYLDVSIVWPPTYCSHGLPAGPCGGIFMSSR